MTWILLAASVALATVDAVVTHRRLRWELNPLVKALSKVSPILSVLLGVFLIQALWAFLLAHFSPLALAIFVGFQTHRTYLQYLSRKFSGWDVKSLPSLRQSSTSDAPPPSRSNHPEPPQRGSKAVARNVQNFHAFISTA